MMKQERLLREKIVQRRCRREGMKIQGREKERNVEALGNGRKM
jgi:hypothetical protein